LNSEPRGPLKIHVPVAFGVLHIAPALKDFLSKCPRLSVDMSLSDEQPNLVEEGYDAAVVIVKEPAPMLVARKLAPNHRRVCATAEYFKNYGTPQSPRDLAEHNCIVHSLMGTERTWCFLTPAGEMRVEVDGSVRFNNENAIRQAALAGAGVALLPTYIVGEDLQRGLLEAALPDFAASDSAVYAVYSSNRHVAAKVREFVDFLVARFSPEPYWDA
jgi:DNA-binding transcriptional LysR family regulator